MAARAMHGSTVLILVRDILGAGLFGALVEGLGKQPAFPFDGERVESAVERLQPTIVLLDCHHAALRSDAFFSAATAAESVVVLFAPSEPWHDVAEIARRRGIGILVHPHDGESLTDVIRSALTEMFWPSAAGDMRSEV